VQTTEQLSMCRLTVKIVLIDVSQSYPRNKMGDVFEGRRIHLFVCYASAQGEGIKRCFCLTSVCLTSVAYIGPNSRTERSRKTKIGTEVAHVTRDSDYFEGQKVKGQLVADVLKANMPEQVPPGE